MSSRTPTLSRRHFLMAGGAAAAAALAASRKPSTAQGGKDKHAKRGYHASEHINNYYRTTKV